MSTAKYNFYWVFVALFAVSLFYPFKAIAQDGPSTLTQFTTIDCPTMVLDAAHAYTIEQGWSEVEPAKATA